MRRYPLPALVGTSAILVLLLTACGSAGGVQTAASPAAPACVDAKAAHKAYVVVQHAAGTTVHAGDTVTLYTNLLTSPTPS